MFSRILSLHIILFIIVFIACGTEITDSQTPDQNTGDLPRTLTLSEKNIINSGNDFSFKIFQRINEWEDKDKNLFISPLSVSYALGMALNGAVGQTKAEMLETMELSGLTDEEINTAYNSLMELLMSLDENVKMDLANSVWIRNDFPVLDSYKKVCGDYFDAAITTMDFSAPNAADIINGWIADKTNDKITDIIEPPIDPAIVMILVNAIYFMADWSIQFDPEDTDDQTFYHSDGSSKTVKMMNIKEDFKFYNRKDYRALELPYSKDLYTMTLVVPEQNINIDEFIADFTSDDMDQLITHLTEPEEITVTIPKLKYRYKLRMNDVLLAMGMNQAFHPGADFSRLSNSGSWIGDVIHEGFVDVNEEGTEAAAATVITFERSISNVFTADRPYIFIIRETKSNTILFMGKVVSPQIDS